MRFALESVVSNGTGHNAYIENYKVGGKTGTAQKVQNGVYLSGNYIVSFMGFMPADNPEIVLYVAINNPKGITQYGGTVSAPVAKNIFKSAIDIFGFEPNFDGETREYLWYETPYIKIPNVIGLNKKEALKVLKDFKIEYTGDGDTIVEMEPKAGYFIPRGGQVRILLDD